MLLASRVDGRCEGGAADGCVARRRSFDDPALASEAGISCIMRRTYKSVTEPAPAGAYDFITYFECADEHLATFDTICQSLRDVRQNPEWRYVTEGPEWRGRRVLRW